MTQGFYFVLPNYSDLAIRYTNDITNKSIKAMINLLSGLSLIIMKAIEPIAAANATPNIVTIVNAIQSKIYKIFFIVRPFYFVRGFV